MKKILSFFTAFIALFSMTGTSIAANCYSSAEYEAEQGLRIQSELMVIALNCQHMAYRKGNLYLRYREVSRQNNDLIKSYEGTLMKHYKREGKNPEKNLNNLRTNLANKVAIKSASMRPDIFCYNHRDYIETAMNMDREAFRRWAKQPEPSNPTSKPLCRDRDY